MGKIFTKQYSPETGLLNKAGATGAGNTTVASNIVAGRLDLLRSSHVWAIVAKWLGVVLLVGMGVSGWGQTNNYFGTSGTISGNVWSTNPAGPYTSPLNTTGGAILNFNNSGFNATGATLSPMPTTWNFGANVGTWTPMGTIGAAGVNVSFNVASGVLMDFGGSQAFSNSGTAAFTKNGTGALGFVGNTFGGGLTLNAGTLVLRGVNACGGGPVILNGGTIAANGNRTIANPTSITINGNIQFGEMDTNVGLVSNTATISFSDNINIGSATRTLTLGNSGNHSFLGVISGSGGITFAANANGANGVFTLAENNTYTGLTRLTGGTVQGTGESMFGASPGSFVANQITFDGGTLRASTANIDFNSRRGITLDAGGGTFNTNGNTITLSNVVTGSGGLTKTGSGTLVVICNTNGGTGATYTGPTSVQAGTLQLSTINNALSQTTNVTLANTAGVIFDLNDLNQTIGSLAGGGASGGNTTLGSGRLTMGNATSTSYAGIISETGGITKQGAGTLTLSGINTYTGSTIINAGTLSISTIANGGSNSNIGASSNAAANLVLGGGTLQYTGATASTDRAFTLTAATNSTIDVTTNTLTISGAAASTSGSLNKAGNGTLVLSGANTYTGTTTVSSGVLNIQNATALGTTAGGTTVSNGAALEIQGGITVGAEAISISGTGIGSNGAIRNISGTNSYGGGITLAAASTIQSDAGTLTLSGGIGGATFGLTLEGASGGTVSGVIATTTGTLTKNDGGTWTLTGSNAYTGVTTINAGTLRLNRIGGSTLPATAVVNINSGGTLQVSSDQTLNSLTLNTGATLTVDAGVTLTIAGTFTYNGGTISSTGSMAYTGGGVIIYNASRTAGIEWNAGNNPAAVTINTGTVTLNSTVTTSGSLTINSPGVLAAGSNTINIGGNWRNYASSGFTEATSTVIFNSSGSQSLNNDGGTEDFFSLSKTGTGTLTLNTNAALAGTSSAFTLSNGIINTGNFGLSGTVSSSFTISGGTLQLGRASTLPEFPTIANYSITGGTIELTGAGNQVLRGGIAYNNLIFSGSSGSKTITSAISSIASVTISGGNIVDVSNNTFGGATTDFTMTDGRFRTQGSGTKPDMGDDYNLTGGVVEFYGNTGTIRTKAYQNIEVTGTNVGNSSGNITLNSGGTFTVKTGGTFSINADAITGPTGSQTVTVENGATFNCGNVEGLVGDALITPPFNSGAIRTNVETIDFQAGSTIGYTSASAQKFTARSDYKNVRINGAGEKTVQGASTIAGNLTLTNGILTTTAATPLTLTTTATTSGGSLSSFVNGPLYKQMQATSADITMPVGKAPADYKPVILADVAGSGTNTFSAEYFPAGATSSPRSSFLASGTVFSVWTGPYWQVDKTGTGINLRVGLFYDPGVTGWSVSAPGSTNRIAVARFNSLVSGWDFTKTTGNFIFDDPLPYVEAIPYGTADTVYTDRISTFSPFTIGHGGNTILILPVTLLRFEATAAGTDALLQWQVAPSATLSHFVVEHSANGQSFTSVQQVAGQVIPVYSYRHSGLTPGTHYYRLKIAEKDGSYTYSPTRQVTSIGYAETQIVQWQHGGPGHTTGQLTIFSQKPQAAQAMLIDMAGRVVKTYPLMLHQGLNTLPVHLPLLAAGIYRLKVNTTDGKHKLLPVLQ